MGQISMETYAPPGSLLNANLHPVRMPGIPTRFSATPGKIGDIGPELGADNRGVLAEAGFTPEEIAGLESSGVLKG